MDNLTASPSRVYPGEAAEPCAIWDLAQHYRAAAHLLMDQGRKGNPLSRAPCRLVAIQAIELYLNVFLLAAGVEKKAVRGLQHDLSERSARATKAGLTLRRKTADHLAQITASREYLTARYGPEMTTTLSQINRLMATLDELAKKVPRPSCETPPSDNKEAIAPCQVQVASEHSEGSPGGSC